MHKVDTIGKLHVIRWCIGGRCGAILHRCVPTGRALVVLEGGFR